VGRNPLADRVKLAAARGLLGVKRLRG
jgi:hypothetical protein